MLKSVAICDNLQYMRESSPVNRRSFSRQVERKFVRTQEFSPLPMMSEILVDFMTIVKLFTATLMCAGGIFLAICYCCCLRDVNEPSELDVVELGKKNFDECIENEETGTPPAGEDASVAQKKAFKNKCYTVEDESKRPDGQPENSTRFLSVLHF